MNHVGFGTKWSVAVFPPILFQVISNHFSQASARGRTTLQDDSFPIHHTANNDDINYADTYDDGLRGISRRLSARHAHSS